MSLKTLDKKQILSLLVPIVCIIVGICFCVISETMLGLFETIICICLIVYGVFYLIVYCFIDSDSRDIKVVLKGVVSLLLGLLIIFVNSFFMISIGVIIAGVAVLRIIRAVRMKKLNINGWKLSLAVSIVGTVLGTGLVVISVIKLSNLVLMIYLGVVLCLHGIYDLTMYIIKHTKKIKTESNQGESQESSSENIKTGSEIDNNVDAKSQANSEVDKPEESVSNESKSKEE